jgi:hypothetical protein
MPNTARTLPKSLSIIFEIIDFVLKCQIFFSERTIIKPSIIKPIIAIIAPRSINWDSLDEPLFL